MKSLRPSSAKCGIRLIQLLLICAAVLSATVNSSPPSANSAADSLSIGLPMGGSLKRGFALPRRGSGHDQMAVSFNRKARFGTRELIRLLSEGGFRVTQKYPGVRLQIGDLSRRPGGPIENHGSHQNGRDADMAFYMLNSDGKPVKPTEFVPFDKNGYSVKPPMTYRFDDRRNWRLVESLLRSNHAQVQWIFVSEGLKARLLATAAKQGADEEIILRAKQALKQPGEAAHWDHFHVRIYCPPSDLPGCRDQGPRWAWAR